MSSRTATSPRIGRTRAALIAAGIELLVERPIDAIPIDDVVAQAGVAKGSFFNHFSDKADFAGAIAAEVRLELEALVAAANEGVDDPLERIAGGMRVSLEFAMKNPKRATALLRSMGSPTTQDHPLNHGLRADVDAAVARGLVRAEAKRAGVLYWLGLCQSLMLDVLGRPVAVRATRQRLTDMLVLGLAGLGVSTQRAAEIAQAQCLQLTA